MEVASSTVRTKGSMMCRFLPPKMPRASLNDSISQSWMLRETPR